jgi:hypothetical protein
LYQTSAADSEQQVLVHSQMITYLTEHPQSQLTVLDMTSQGPAGNADRVSKLVAELVETRPTQLGWLRSSPGSSSSSASAQAMDSQQQSSSNDPKDKEPSSTTQESSNTSNKKEPATPGLDQDNQGIQEVRRHSILCFIDFLLLILLLLS